MTKYKYKACTKNSYTQIKNLLSTFLKQKIVINCFFFLYLGEANTCPSTLNIYKHIILMYEWMFVMHAFLSYSSNNDETLVNCITYVHNNYFQTV